jgi:hypothetical protein
MDWQTLCNEAGVRKALWRAWKESEPDSEDAHEEGGFILATEVGFEFVRWPIGESYRIRIPPHPGCKIDDKDIVATFHTHPHSGSGCIQEPSGADMKTVRDDVDLKGQNYIGEFVLAFERTYLIAPDGRFQDIGRTPALFGP